MLNGNTNTKPGACVGLSSCSDSMKFTDTYYQSYRAGIQEDHLPSLRRKSWEVPVAGGGDAVIDGDFDAASELHYQQIVDLTLEMHAKGVQDERLLRGCFHPHYDLLQLVQLFLHSTHHHNHHVQLLGVLLVVIPP